MSKKTLMKSIRPFIRKKVLKLTANDGDTMPVFWHVNCTPYDAASLGEYRALYAEYKAERDNMARKKRKRKANALKANVILNYPDGAFDVAEFYDVDEKKCSMFTKHGSGSVGVCQNYGSQSVEFNADTAAALIPLLKRFVRTGRIVKPDDGG